MVKEMLAVPLLLLAANNKLYQLTTSSTTFIVSCKKLKIISFLDIPIDDQELLEMARVLQSNTSLTQLYIESKFEMRYTFESLTKFVEIVTAPESRSQLELLEFGKYYKENNNNIVLLSNQLTHMAASRGHKLVVQPAFLNTKYSEWFGLGMDQGLKANAMPDWLLYGKV